MIAYRTRRPGVRSSNAVRMLRGKGGGAAVDAKVDVEERRNTGIIGLQHGVVHTAMVPQRCSMLREVAAARSHERC